MIGVVGAFFSTGAGGPPMVKRGGDNGRARPKRAPAKKEMAMAADYIPNPDLEFDDFQNNFQAYVAAHLVGLGLVAGDIAGVNAAQLLWKPAWTAHTAAIDAAKAAKLAKDRARTGYEAAIRALVRRLQSSPSVDDTERAAMRITIADTNPTLPGPPTGKPLITINCGERLRHTLSWTDASTPTRKAKPPGVLGMEIRLALTAVGAAVPADPDQFAFIALDTATPYLNEFIAANAGKNASYIGRWVNSQNQHGPWSETVTATVGG